MTISQFVFDVARGRVKDTFPLSAYGYNRALQNTPETIWSVGELYEYPTTAAPMLVTSSVEADRLVGVGAQQIAIYGLDEDFEYPWDEGPEIVDMGGVTHVTTQRSYSRIISATAITVGTSGFADGNISIGIGNAGPGQVSTVYAQIPALTRRTYMAVFTVPKGWAALILSYSGGGHEVTTAGFEFSLRSGPVGQPVTEQGWVGTGTRDLVIPAVVREMNDVELRGLTKKQVQDAMGWITALLVKEPINVWPHGFR